MNPFDDEELFQAVSGLCDGEQAAAMLGAWARGQASGFTWEWVAARVLTSLAVLGSSEPPLFDPE